MMGRDEFTTLVQSSIQDCQVEPSCCTACKRQILFFLIV